MEDQMIMQYVRDGSRRKLGVVVAVRYDDQHYSIGYSVVRKERGELIDDFDSDLGIKIAIGRALNPRFSKILPSRVKKTLKQIEKRAQSYFKGMSQYYPLKVEKLEVSVE